MDVELYAQLSAQLEAEFLGIQADELTVHNTTQANLIQHGCLKHAGEYTECVSNIRTNNQYLLFHIRIRPKILSLPDEIDNDIFLKF